MELFPTVTPTIIENVDMVIPPEIEKLSEILKFDGLKDIQHEIQTPGTPNRNKIGKKIADMTFKSRQDLKKKGVLQVTGRKLYIVGGVVRDWLIHHFHGIAHSPDDYDLATDASTEAFKLIVHTAIVNRKLPEDTSLTTNDKKFGNIQLKMSGKTFDITTFPFTGYANAPRIYLDSLRRNFNVNALYYSIDEKKIYDYHAGITDIYRKSPKFIGSTKSKLQENDLYPLIYARLHARMNGDLPQDKQKELNHFVLPYNVDRNAVYSELQKGVKQSLDKAKYFRILHDIGILKQILPGLKVNPNIKMGEMTLFPQALAQVLQPNWNNIGHLAEVLKNLAFHTREIHDIIFLVKLPFYRNEESLKADRFHTGLSARAIEQFVKTNQLHNADWILKAIK